MAAWPAGLPAPQVQSYHTRDVAPVIRTDMESGPQRMARSSAHYMTVGQMTIALDATQHATFEQLYQDSNNGTDWITDVPIDTSGNLANHRIRITSVQRKIIRPPNVYWNVTLSFETDEHLT